MSTENSTDSVKRMSIYLGVFAFLLISLFILVIYFSSPAKGLSINVDQNSQSDTSLYNALQKIEMMNKDLSSVEQLLYHYETEDRINPKKIEYFLSNYNRKLTDENHIKENISNNPALNERLKLSLLEIIKNIEVSSKIAHNRLDYVPIASPLEVKYNKLYIVSGFGMRKHPIYNTMKMHTGIDLRGKVGSHIIATASGKVIKNGNRGGYGYSCEIRHKYGYSTVYAHMVRTTVSIGQWVNKGEEIGFIGSTGVSEGPHLHYEIRKNNEPINPVPYIFEKMTPEEYKKWVEK